MSLKYEQYRALQSCRDLLTEILTKPQRVMIRSSLRLKAAAALRHFPPLTDEGAPMFSGDDFPRPKDWNE